MDLALAIERLVPAAIYSGSTNGNDEAAYGALVWSDARPKPDFAAIVAADPGLAPLRAAEKRAVDLDAGAERLKYISGGDGQELVYQRKAEEARHLLAALAADPGYVADPADYPMLAAGLGLDGATLADCAALVAARDAAWTPIAAAIDLIRRTARAAIDAAADEAAIRAVRPAVQWLAGA